MRHCKKCVMPDTRPRITFDENGICSACQYAEEKKHIDWVQRRRGFEQLLDRYRSKNGGYDCIIPCSGGKDSSTIAYKMKHEFKMHPLLVTVSPCIYTDVGKRNLESLLARGFDHIMYTCNPEISRKLARKLFFEFGDHFVPWVQAIFAVPLKIAVKFNVPLVVYAEDGEAEYGGGYEKGSYIDEITEGDIKLYLSGNDPKDWIDEDIKARDLESYFLPPAEELKRIGVKPIKFGYFTRWNPYENYLFAKEHTGFQSREGRSWGTYTNYASLDDKTDEFHYYLEWIKFGFCRATSDVCHEIRDGQITREKGVELAKKYDGNFPPEESFREFLEYIRISEREFWQVIEKFRNQDIWEKHNGEWRLKTPLK